MSERGVVTTLEEIREPNLPTETVPGGRSATEIVSEMVASEQAKNETDNNGLIGASAIIAGAVGGGAYAQEFAQGVLGQSAENHLSSEDEFASAEPIESDPNTFAEIEVAMLDTNEETPSEWGGEDNELDLNDFI
jgi:hypothetical protein